MAHTENNTEALLGSQEQFEALVQEKLIQASTTLAVQMAVPGRNPCYTSTLLTR